MNSTTGDLCAWTAACGCYGCGKERFRCNRHFYPTSDLDLAGVDAHVIVGWLKHRSLWHVVRNWRNARRLYWERAA